jgi:hypothetical protein
MWGGGRRAYHFLLLTCIISPGKNWSQREGDRLDFREEREKILGIFHHDFFSVKVLLSEAILHGAHMAKGVLGQDIPHTSEGRNPSTFLNYISFSSPLQHTSYLGSEEFSALLFVFYSSPYGSSTQEMITLEAL